MSRLILNGNDLYGSHGESVVELSATLAVGATTLSFTDGSITNTSMIDVYTDTFGVNPTNMTQNVTTLTLTFDEQEAAIGVKVLVRG